MPSSVAASNCGAENLRNQSRLSSNSAASRRHFAQDSRCRRKASASRAGRSSPAKSGISFSACVHRIVRASSQIGGAFGARLLGTALVVHFDAAAIIGDKSAASFVPEVCRIVDDYQSGTELPRSKGFADLNYACSPITSYGVSEFVL